MHSFSKNKIIHPLMSWDIIALQFSVRAQQHDFKKLYQMKEKFKWSLDLDSVLAKKFDAVVLTKINQEIVWVSNGFKTMTGYDKTFAIGKRPAFLQGEQTSETSRNMIRHALAQQKEVACSLTNYRHDGSPYACAIQIMPIFNQKNDLIHFIALETTLL